MIVYLITNTMNGKGYVGMTSASLETRWRRHQTVARNGGNTYFCAALRKYGVEIFHPEILYVCESRTEAAKVEKEYISLFDLHNPKKGYNLTDGGEGTWGWQHTDSAKLKMSQAKAGKPSHWKGKTRSEVSRLKMSLAKQGAATSGGNNPFFGKKHSEQTRQAISQSRIGSSRSLESRLKQAETMRKLRAEKFWSSRKA